MMSKKAFSLTSLITILVLAFVVTPAMAADFGVSLEMTRDISTDGGLQLLNPHYHDRPSNVAEVVVLFDRAVDLTANKANISVSGFDMKDNYLPSIMLVPKGGNYPNGPISPHDRASTRFIVKSSLPSRSATASMVPHSSVAIRRASLRQTPAWTSFMAIGDRSSIFQTNQGAV